MISVSSIGDDRPTIIVQIKSPDAELWEDITPGRARELAAELLEAADAIDAYNIRKDRYHA